MLSNIYILLSGLPCLICLFWSVMLLAHYKKSHFSKQILFWFMFVATTLYFGHFCVFNRIWSLIPLTDTIYTFATLSVYPIYSIYLKGLTGHVGSSDLKKLLPGLIIASIVGYCYALMPENIESDFLLACHYSGENYPTHWTSLLSEYAHLSMKPLIVVQVIHAAVTGFHQLNRFKRRVGRCFSNTEHRDLSEIRHLLILLLGTSCLSVIADLLGRNFFLGSFMMWSIPMIAFSIMLFCIGWVGFQQQFTITDLLREEAMATAIPTHHDSRDLLRKKLDVLMEKEKLYLRPDLKISEVATILGSNRTYVQEALKTKENNTISFSDYVNHYRIDYSIILLLNDKKATMNEIMEKSGYQSRATFYRNFKKFTGKSPDLYLKDHSL